LRKSLKQTVETQNNMENPWNFFSRKFVISLEEASDRKESLVKEFERFSGLNYEIVKAVDGRKNPILRRWFELTHVISTPYPQTDGALGCLASHRKVWQTTLEDTVKFPSWVLIMEDDVRFHPLLTNDHLKMYLDNVPKDAKVLKFGYLKKPHVEYTRENKYWWNLSKKSVYSNICYAVRSDMLPNMLAIKDIIVAVDCYVMDNVYGAALLEEAFDLPDTSKFREYKNPNTGKTEHFLGFVNVADFESTTMVTSKDNVLVIP
jgi:GR25 family glycosyltransferase involved in LPS biosynthesis